MSDRERFPIINLHGQYTWHDRAKIVLNEQGRKALIEALSTRMAGVQAFASDGEGYDLTIEIIPDGTPVPDPFYTQEYEWKAPAQQLIADKWAAVRRCAEVCEKAEIQTVAAKGRETAARIKVAIKAEFPEAFK